MKPSLDQYIELDISTKAMPNGSTSPRSVVWRARRAGWGHAYAFEVRFAYGRLFEFIRTEYLGMETTMLWVFVLITLPLWLVVIPFFSAPLAHLRYKRAIAVYTREHARKHAKT